jgi:hypothetical protein
MAGDSALTIRKVTSDSFAIKSTAVAYKRVVLSSTASVTIDISTIDVSKLVILLDRPADAKNPTIRITDGGSTSNPLFFTGGAQGNIDILTTAAGEYAIGAIESARFKDTSANINITKSTTDTAIVYVEAILLP